MYRVIHDFADMQDNGFLYHAGDAFPRNGVKADKARLSILSSNSNRIGEPLIEEVEEAPKDETPKVEKTDKPRGRKRKPVEG